jgi:hypothetical protein
VGADLELWPIGNCQVSGLIDEEAGLVWACVPTVNADPVFRSVLNGDRHRDDVWRLELDARFPPARSSGAKFGSLQADPTLADCLRLRSEKGARIGRGSNRLLALQHNRIDCAFIAGEE